MDEMTERSYCLVPDCDEQPAPGEELCLTHLEEAEAFIREDTRWLNEINELLKRKVE